MRAALCLIELAEPLSQPVCFHPYCGVFRRIEGSRPAQHFDTDLIFLDFVRGSFEIFGGKILKQPRQSGRSNEQRRGQNRLEFSSRLFCGRGDLNLKHWAKYNTHPRVTLATFPCTLLEPRCNSAPDALR